MKTIATTVAFIFTLIFAQAEDKQYNEHGFSFTHSADLSTTVTGEAVKTILVKNEKGTQFLLQNYNETITPEALQPMMMTGLIKQFGDKATQLENKAVVRSILGKKREGSYLLIIEQGIPIECIVFIFKEGGNTFCFMTQQPLKDTPQAEKYFAQIQSTLKFEK